MKQIKPIYVFVFLMVLGAFLTIGSYDLGKRAGTQEIITGGLNGMKNHSWEINEDKIKASTEAYKSLGCIVLLVGGIGLVAVMIKE